MAPIVLFVYNRTDHLRLTIEALLLNELAEASDLVVYSDAAKNAASESSVAEVRAFLATVSGFKTIKIIHREANYGLAKSVISGVTEVLRDYESVIVLEDDLITSPNFLRYMNDALTVYEQDERVVSVHGYIYPVQTVLPEVFFLPGADCWGWATWRRGWRLFNGDGRALLAELERRKLSHAFDFDGSYPYTQMLRDQVAGKNSSWAIRWYASAFLAEKLTLYPGRSLVRNIGNDDSGTHCGDTDLYDVELALHPLDVEDASVVASEVGRQAFIRFFRANADTWVVRVLRRVKRLVKG